MATLALGTAGALIGNAVLPSIGFLGSTLTGAAIGQAAGALVGSYIDQALFGASGQSRTVEGPRLADLTVMASTEGAPVPRLYGRARLGGQVIWATRIEEEAVTSGGQTTGSKLTGTSQTSPTETDYRYFANFAVGLSEGLISGIGRVFADGKEIDLSAFTYRVHLGSETQTADSLIVAKEVTAPAYRGLAYIVFERMPLERFGNRLPQLAFEVFRRVDDFAKVIKAVTLIPAAGEFAYELVEVQRDVGGGETESENLHTLRGGTDFKVAVDDLEASLPNVATVSLVVSWFGDDLRAGNCTLRPKIEGTDKVTHPKSWAVAGLDRATATLMPQLDGRPAFGGTPSDASVIAGIQNLRARGQKVTFYPFILLPILSGNSLPNPYGGTSQPAFPWRGRITCHPAAGQAGTVDKTAAAATQIANFVGTATPAHFTISGGNVVYSGPAEWTLRRMVLHYAKLCVAAGGVDNFLIASELPGLSTVRSAASTFPFVTALASLAADVKSILGAGTKVAYAADWSEYFGHQPADGTGDVYFHLDPLWMSASIDAIGIDNYWPLADWRDGDQHLDKLAGALDVYDLDYLKSNVQGGEGYAWYYASAANRDAQIRTPITDGYGKPWVFRTKDIKSWWLNQHFNRPAGVQSVTPTVWVPQSKPFWFTETGCPAVDRGANQPNVFYDPKSTESFFPYYSKGIRDDLMQQRFLQAMLEYFDPLAAGYVANANPTSTVYSGRMVDISNIYAYTWDARPYPAFPNATLVWSDGANWQYGHWLNGRSAGGSVESVITAILGDYGFTDFTTKGVSGTIDGYVLDRVMSARSALQPLELAYFIDTIETAGLIKFRQRGATSLSLLVSPDDLVEVAAEKPLFEVRRAHETELPGSARVRFIDSHGTYRQAAIEARRGIAGPYRIAEADLPIIMPSERAVGIAETMLRDAWAGRETVRLQLPPSALALEPSDLVSLNVDGRTQTFRITGATEDGVKEIEAIAVEPGLFDGVVNPQRPVPSTLPVALGPSTLLFLDLPLLDPDAGLAAGYFAAYQAPWPGGVAVYRTSGTSGYTLDGVVGRRATLGKTTSVLKPGPTSRFDLANSLDVTLDYGALVSVTDLALFDGANTLAIETSPGVYEIIQFGTATLTGTKSYRLTRLLRGQSGTEAAIPASLAAGARIVLLDGSIRASSLPVSSAGRTLNWSYGPANRALGDPTYRAASLSLKGIPSRPYSPVHVRGVRGAGDLNLSWVRRTRVGGDSWDAEEVPLGEATEAYEVDIMNGAAVKRTLTSSTPAVTYTAAQQIADWGAAQTTYALRVVQKSATFGRGTPALASI